MCVTGRRFDRPSLDPSRPDGRLPRGLSFGVNLGYRKEITVTIGERKVDDLSGQMPNCLVLAGKAAGIFAFWQVRSWPHGDIPGTLRCPVLRGSCRTAGMGMKSESDPAQTFG